MAAKRKRKSVRDGGSEDRFTLRLLSGDEFVFRNDDGMRSLAMKWARIVAQRKRWSSSAAAKRRRRSMALDDLRSMTLVAGNVPSDRQLEGLAGAAVVEVQLPAARADAGWPLRIFPWETFLGEIARHFRQRSPLIVRCLAEAPAARSASPKPGTQSALFVDGAPGALEHEFSYEDEWMLFREHMRIERPAGAPGAPSTAWLEPQRRSNPSRDELSAWMQNLRPSVLHVTGLDAHEGARLLQLTYDRRRQDGYYVRNADGSEAVLDPEHLAATLAPSRGRPYPDLACFAIHNAGARICPAVVGRCAGAAVGMVDRIDNATAEQFFGSFYRALRHSGFAILASFRHAIRETASTPRRLRGAGIALWGEGSFLAALDDDPAAWADALDGQTEEIRTSIIEARRDELARLLESTGTGTGLPEGTGSSGTGSGAPERMVRVDPQPLPSLNYGRLHNGCSLFESFVLGRDGPARAEDWAVEDIAVEVDLHVGSHDFQYRGIFDIAAGKENEDITDHVRVPLTWEYMSTMKESVQSTVLTRVTHGGRVVHEKTQPVRLLPVNEWSDTDADRIFLASFVLPSDPAIGQIIDSAQKYLGAYGDPSAGFDGYQSVRRRPRLKGDPDKRKMLREDVSGVDHQVGAIWHALLEDYGLKYVNPPPTYSDSSQRLRTPSRILREGRGTCIDLALLFAACLEYIEIHPALFLMTGHAFAGYWRSETAFSRFHDVTLPEAVLAGTEVVEKADLEVPTNNPADDGVPDWAITPLRYDEIMDRVWKEHLAPVETVYLTDRQPLWAAWDAGIENLESREEFDVMLQLFNARRDPDMNATPIPFEGGL